MCGPQRENVETAEGRTTVAATTGKREGHNEERSGVIQTMGRGKTLPCRVSSEQSSACVRAR